MSGNYTVTDTGNDYRGGSFRYLGECQVCFFQTHLGSSEDAGSSISAHVSQNHGLVPEEVTGAIHQETSTVSSVKSEPAVQSEEGKDKEGTPPKSVHRAQEKGK